MDIRDDRGHPVGSYICAGKDTGRVVGGYTPCQMEGCRGVRIFVRWPDGSLTKPCSRGLTFNFDKNMWYIIGG
jgi:hypothetical protein